MEKVNVNQEKCMGCGACISIAPETFDFNEDGLSHAVNDEVTDQVKEMIENHICPTDAIEVVKK